MKPNSRRRRCADTDGGDKTTASPRPAMKRFRAWKLEDAKARFSEVVRLACADGPQRVTRRGVDAVVVIAARDLERLLPAPASRRSLVEFLRNTALAEIVVDRSKDRGRDVAL